MKLLLACLLPLMGLRSCAALSQAEACATSKLPHGWSISITLYHRTF